jgi:IstB-like ATP binding protein
MLTHPTHDRLVKLGLTCMANPTIADAILDRLVHNAHRLTLKGESMRKTAAKTAGLNGKQDA